MTEDEIRSLESFARCLGVSFGWEETPRGLVAFAGEKGNSRFEGFQRFTDAVRFLSHVPSSEQGWRESGKLN